ncbi:hypothetical protein [Parahaliea aestuarii]|uniref:Uncharacterized protein n=1 Tax=Parahaliea aestuarii TaxID=1852021 RepID=A0A5C8ZKL7_9GAMM|nr:hypothetical protein [Parahaliea aestuarii]TXS89106.1 hypothetical protein FVW59_18455 [Parahaliea aestuarii]
MNAPRAMLFSLLLASGLALGQEPAGEGDPNRPAATENDSAAPAAATDKADNPPPRDDSPFDYQASEQISEDLSVSFPVDI